MNTPSATITALHDELRRLQIPAQIDAIDRGRVCTRGPVFYVVGDGERLRGALAELDEVDAGGPAWAAMWTAASQREPAR